jgi:pilus assembly protein Flp/PilA
MLKFLEKTRDFLADESGLTTVEYAVAGALISVTIIAAFIALSNAVEFNINSIIKIIKSLS